jgi:hypothetical protein
MNLVMMAVGTEKDASGGGALLWKYCWQGKKVHSEVATNYRRHGDLSCILIHQTNLIPGPSLEPQVWHHSHGTPGGLFSRFHCK